MRFGNKKNFIEKNFNILYKIPRYYYILGIFIIAFLFIIITVFKYTIEDYDFYKEKADNQHILEVKIPITRGNIYSTNKEKNTTLSTSVNLNDLAIDPTQPGDKDKLTDFLSNIIYKEICGGNIKQECIYNTLKFLKEKEISNFKLEKTYIKDLIKNKLNERISEKYITSVLISQNLEKEISNKILNLKIKGLYIYENSFYINPEEIGDKELISKILSPIISFPEESLLYSMRRRERKYIPLLKKLSIDVSAEIQDFLDNEKNAIKKGYVEKEETISSFIQLTPNPHRFYPENETASQVLGFVDKEGKGHYGIEGYFNDVLEGESKEIIIKKDIRGRIINPIDLSEGFIKREGAVIYSTIDRNIQKNVEDILEKGVKKYNANKGSVIVINPKNGKILTMANYPKYNPNNHGDVYEMESVKYGNYTDAANELIGKLVFVEDIIEGKEYYINGEKKLLREATREELSNYELKKYKYKNDFGANVYRNATISDIYEPGSIMKAFTMAIGIDSGEITRNTYYVNNGPIKIDQFPISDVSSKCLGTHTFSHALNYSCNVGMVRIIQKVGKALLYNYLDEFGFGKLTEVTLDGEVSLPIKDYQKWSNAQLYTTSYGLGINVNQLQMAVGYSALVNGGLILRPQIIDKIDFHDGKIINFKKEVLRRAISEKTSKTMIDVLVDSMEKGVAKTGKVESYLLGGKTGTSQIAYKGGYEDGNMPGATNASFAGFGPAQDPQFVIIVKLERPRTNNYGSLTSAYIFSDIASYLLEYYKIPKIK